MGLHACNENCDLHPDLHWIQRNFLPDEGGHRPPEEDRATLLKILKEKRTQFDEVIEVLEANTPTQ